MAELYDSIIMLRRAVDGLRPGGVGFDEVVRVLREIERRRYRIKNAMVDIHRQYVAEGTWDDDNGEEDYRKLWNETWEITDELDKFEEKFKKVSLGEGSKEKRKKIDQMLYMSRIAAFGIR